MASLRSSCAPVAVALAVTIAAGCDGGGARTATRTSSGRPPSSRRYKWLVPLSGGQPSVAAENQARGTDAWRLPGPSSDVGGLATGDVRGYAGRETIAPGQLERIYVDAPGSRRVRIAVFRMGWYGGRGGREVLVSEPLRVRRQPPCTHLHATGLTECSWRPTLSFRIPDTLASGVFIAKLTARSGASDVLFVVTAARPAPLVAVLPTATYEAYNAWGGDSLYPGGSDPVGVTNTTQGVAVSYSRPYDSVTGAGQFFARDVAMVRFLERYRLPVGYTTSEGVDMAPERLRSARAVIDFGHSEYGSQRGYNAFLAARDHGVNLLFLSSDTLAWRVRFGPGSGGATAPDQTIVAYKKHSVLDPIRAAPTGAFGPAAAALTGSRYLGCILPRLARPGPPVYNLFSWRAPPRLRPHWLFAGTGLSPGVAIPGILGYELDTTAAGTPRGTIAVGGGSAPCRGVDSGGPVPPPGPGRATTTLYTAPSGAFVFASGTLGWELGLEAVPSASPQAPRAPIRALVRLTLNLIHRALRP